MLNTLNWVRSAKRIEDTKGDYYYYYFLALSLIYS